MRFSSIKADEFAALSPYLRGYVVELFGKSCSQPHVPKEANPFAPYSREHGEYEQGRNEAKLRVQLSAGQASFTVADMGK